MSGKDKRSFQFMRHPVSVLLVVLCSMAYYGYGQGNVAVVFYNCENFFDTVHNPLKEDEEFTPQGKYRYNTRIYEQKLHNIATVLESMKVGGGPVMIGLAEIENTTVLHDLVRQPEIARRNYKYVWYDGPDVRGINVALVYDPQRFHVLSSEPVHVDLTAVQRNSKTRDILHVCGVLDGDTVHVFVNHWPSNRGGEEESAPKRLKAAETCLQKIRDIHKQSPAARIIVMGDFNDNPLSNVINRVMGASSVMTSVRPDGLYDPWAELFRTGQGTEVYRHEWNLFDMILISGSLLQMGRHLHYDRAEIYKPDFLVDHYKGHEGEPKRSFVGTHWINGYSDHFPVVVYLGKN